MENQGWFSAFHVVKPGTNLIFKFEQSNKVLEEKATKC